MFPFINFLFILAKSTQSINPYTNMFTILINSKSSIISKYIHFINNIIRFNYLAYNYNHTFISFFYFVLNILQLCFWWCFNFRTLSYWLVVFWLHYCIFYGVWFFIIIIFSKTSYLIFLYMLQILQTKPYHLDNMYILVANRYKPRFCC